MRTDIRENAARYYDLSPENPDDVPFYLHKIPSPQARVLELGCGTGRVLVPLAKKCSRILGIDVSEGMLARCHGNWPRGDFPRAAQRFGRETLRTLSSGNSST